jgi:hypothetical protein
VANAGQKLSLRVRLEVRPTPQRAGKRLARALVTCVLTCLLARGLFAPLTDFYARGRAAQAAVAHGLLLEDRSKLEATVAETGGWLRLPWTALAWGADTQGVRDLFGGDARARLAAREFQSNFNSYFVRDVVLWTWWLGAAAGVMLALRRGRVLDVPFGLIAGSVAGVILTASVACVVLSGDLVPLFLWGMLIGKGSVALLPVWVVLALACWTGIGLAAGLVLLMLPPLRPVLDGAQAAMAGLLRACGLRGPAKFFAPA